MSHQRQMDERDRCRPFNPEPLRSSYWCAKLRQTKVLDRLQRRRRPRCSRLLSTTLRKPPWQAALAEVKAAVRLRRLICRVFETICDRMPTTALDVRCSDTQQGHAPMRRRYLIAIIAGIAALPLAALAASKLLPRSRRRFMRRCGADSLVACSDACLFDPTHWGRSISTRRDEPWGFA